MRRRYLTIAKKAMWLCGCAWGAGNGACFVALVTQREDPIILIVLGFHISDMMRAAA